MPIYKEIIKHIDTKPIIIIPSKFSQKYINEVYGDLSDFTISNNTYETLVEVDFAFICSGTATLEAALIGTPFVLNYKAKKIDYFIGNKLVKINFIGLANIFFEKMGKKPMHKEYVQEEVTVENLLNEYKNLDRESFLENSKILRDYLQHGSSKTVAKLITQKN
jgi:lipid-A-disaccharide synthase